MDAERTRRPRVVWIVLTAAVALVAVQYAVCGEAAPKTIAYSELIDRVDKGEVAEVEIRATEIRAKMRDGERRVAERLPAVDEPKLVDRLREHGVKFSGKAEQRSWLTNLFAVWILPLGMIALLYFVLFRRAGRGGGPLTFGRAQAKIYDKTLSEKVTFDDVAGIDEVVAELTEVVDFLKHPAKYRALGARIPKGVLLVGPPGTGKTLVAKAVAGEADVPFFSISGSEFVEMFVGVGAARMRSLFEQAKERAPCIVFLDELDAIGKSRGGLGAMATHDEREQTLNQLLVEMDGFDPGVGVIIIAATNRPEVLDPALVRAGRFDRQVLVDRPDLAGREAILEVHARDIVLAGGVDLEVIARRTPGMAGADLANIVNEAALAAARRGSPEVDDADFEEAIDRVQLGLEKKGRVMRESEKRRVAVHEAGHALVALSVEHADPVHRVTIVPRSIGALGATLQLPTEERYLMTRDELADQLCVMLGGRAAEQVSFGDTSTGAENDLERATETARQMICRFGMSDELGARSFGRPGSRFLDPTLQLDVGRDFSDDTARRIDAEIDALLAAQLDRARELLSAREATLEAIRDRLLESETIDADDLAAIVERTDVRTAHRAPAASAGAQVTDPPG